jgi:hypothetical protein
VRVENFQIYTKFVRYDWMNQIGIVGGIYGFYGGIILSILSYFTSIDYLTTVIQKLFLEENSDMKFYNRFLNDDGKAKRIKSNCW